MIKEPKRKQSELKWPLLSPAAEWQKVEIRILKNNHNFSFSSWFIYTSGSMLNKEIWILFLLFVNQSLFGCFAVFAVFNYTKQQHLMCPVEDIILILSNNRSQINLEIVHMPRMEQGIGTHQLGY